MPDSGSTAGSRGSQSGWFATTLWHVVEAAGDQSSPQAREALELLCRTYWYPLYSYVRRQGRSPEDAEDITQLFLARLVAKSYLGRADRQLGSFRMFLLAGLRNFLVDEWRREWAERRGKARIISWEGHSPEEQYQHEPASDLSPDKIFDQRWAATLFQRAFGLLRDEFSASGKEKEFTLLKGFLSADRPRGEYASLAPRLGLSAAMVSVAIHRLRRRYGELVRQEIAATVTNRAEIEGEMRYLIGIMTE